MQNKIFSEETRFFFFFICLVIALGTISIIGQSIKRKKIDSYKEPVAEQRHSFEQKLNQNIKKTIIKEIEESPEIYLGISNNILDTAWHITKKDALTYYNILKNKYQVAITEYNIATQKKEKEERLQKIIELEEQMESTEREHGEPYGWIILHKCFLQGEIKEIVIESDTLASKILELYGNRNNFHACPDSAALQVHLKKNIQ
ncbi:MAG: hypothetical protein K6E35_06285 [Bacteroidales bacterium]|nr:hypothetical protein [Bacteroidales bacterium]